MVRKPLALAFGGAIVLGIAAGWPAGVSVSQATRFSESAVHADPRVDPTVDPTYDPPIEEVVPVPPDPVIDLELGIMSWMPEKYGATYLALPEGPGHFVRICAASCVELESIDTGPNQRIHPDRVADLNVVLWEQVCGLHRDLGLCFVSVEFLGGIE